jgi:hypothetical protein
MQNELALRIEACELCGEELEIDLLEVWREERAFMISTCCEGMHAAVIDELQGGSRAPWIRNLFAGYGIDVRQVYAEDDGWLRLDFGLELREIDLRTAKDFVARHHRHNRPPCSWRWGHALYNADDLVAVAMVGRPVARMLDARTIVEVTRLCVDPSLARALVWNACSMLYGAARKEARRRGFRTIITYTLEDEAATSVRAAGWTAVAKTRGGSWNRPSRVRTDRAPTCPKIRWEARA